MNKTMIPTSRRAPARTVLAAIGLFAATAVAAPAALAQAGPFSNLAGAWSGGGQISFADGRSERIRCRSDNKVGDAGNEIQQTLRCASDSYKFELNSSAQSRGGQILGTWNETTRNVNGNLSGNAAGGRIQVRAAAGNFAVALTLTANGNAQSVTIQPEGQTEIAGAAIKLTRGG